MLLENNNAKTRSKDIKPNMEEEIQFKEEFLSEHKSTIYPNPTKGHLMIDVTNLDPDIENIIYGYTPSGQLIVTKKVTEERTDIDLNNQPNGTYLFYIILGKEKSIWKIIKQ